MTRPIGRRAVHHAPQLSSIDPFLALVAWPVLAFGSELAVVGTGDGIEVLKALSTAFNRMESATEVTIPPSIGSGGGIAAVGAGKASLGRVARTLTEAELARGLVYTPVLRLPSAIFIHPSAQVTDLTAAQIFASGWSGARRRTAR